MMAETLKQTAQPKGASSFAAHYIPQDVSAELVYLYRLVEGASMSSHGYHCALKAGMPLEIIQRAQQVSAQLTKNEPIMRIDCEKDESLRRSAEAIVSTFSKFDLQNGNVQQFFSKIKEIASPKSAPGSSGVC